MNINLGKCYYKIKGLNVERLINSFLKNGIEIIQISKDIDTIMVAFNYNQKKKAIELLSNYEILQSGYTGACYWLQFFKHHILLIIGIVLSVLILIFWQTHLFNYEITGLQRLNKIQVEKFLSNKGYGIGCTLNSVNTKQVALDLVSGFKELSFASVMKVGCSLVINVKEIDYDENLDESLVLPIKAGFDGVISEINAYQGTPLVKVGDIVKKGQVLIAPYVEVSGISRPIRARGEVKASIFLKGQVVFNEKQKIKVRSGNKTVAKSIEMLGTEFPCSAPKIDYPEYEIEKSTKIICKNMPISIKIIERSYYEMIENVVCKSFESEKEFLIKKSRYLAYQELKANFDVVSEQTDIVNAGENYYITTYIKVLTEIGVSEK